jgi:adenylosuccinate synthase
MAIEPPEANRSLEDKVMLTAIVGINWGDEGKGRMVDLLSERYDVVARYQGGNNAGHTVINEQGKFILNLLPSGILRPEVVNVMGNGMVIDLRHLADEMGRLREGGVDISPDNLVISDRAVICMPYHVTQDILEEDRLGDAKYGSTRRGIAPVYGDKYMKKALRMGDLAYPDRLRKRLAEIVEWKNMTIEKAYGAPPLDADALFDWLTGFGAPLAPYIRDTGLYLESAIDAGRNVMFEAQLGALRDIDFGIYPYTSSSSTIAAYAPSGAGVPGRKLTNTIGIMKAYSTCVGEGPFTAEMFGAEADALRGAGGEYGAATGRPRRVGAFDAVASRYGTRIQGADEIALTKMDVMSYMDRIPVCENYEIAGGVTDEFPVGEALAGAKPVITYRRGWKSDISGCRKRDELPDAALDYIAYIEEAVRCPVRYVSVGAERGACIDMGEKT